MQAFPPILSMAAWQSLTSGLALEVWQMGAVSSGVEHTAMAEGT